jgi:hypothetical protein
MRTATIIIFVISLFICSSAAVHGTPDEDNAVLAALTEFYDAGKAEDAKRYIASHDEIYIDAISDVSSYRGYVSGAFEQFDTLSYSIESPRLFIEDKKALVYYELKARVRITETGETKDIDNSMVAFLWRYDSWKVRYTVLESLYNQKVESSIIALAAMDLAEDSADNTTLKQQMIELGKYTPNEEDLKKPGISSIFIIILIVAAAMLVAGFFGYRFFAEKKHKHRKE